MTTNKERWAKAANDFSTALRARRIAESTIKKRVKVVERLSYANDLSPWEMEYEHIQNWLNDLPVGAETVRAHRSAVRDFYQWAHKAGRVFTDPTVDIMYRAIRLPVPAEWDPEIKAYRNYLRAAGRPETTVKTYIDRLSQFARETPHPPWAVTFDDLIEWFSGKHWASEYRRSFRNILKNFYDWALATERCASNEATKLPIIRAMEPNPRPASNDAYTQALANATERESLMLRLACEIGMRRAELSQVHTRDLINDSGMWFLVVHGKGNKNRTLPLPDGLSATLRALPQGFAFPGNHNGHLSPPYVGKLISRLLPEGVTPHALRHSFATRAYNVKRDVFTVQKLMGHASPATTQKYVAVSDASMRDLVNAIN